MVPIDDTACLQWRVSYKKQELLTRREHLSSPSVFCRDSITHHFCFLCFVFVICLSSFFLSCVPKVAMSLDCLFIIVTSIFSNVDLLKLMIWVIFVRSTICHLLYLLIGNIWWSPLQDMLLTYNSFEKSEKLGWTKIVPKESLNGLYHIFIFRVQKKIR